MDPQRKFRELVQHVKAHDSFAKLYGNVKAFRSIQTSSSTSPPSKKVHRTPDSRIFGLDCEMVITVDEDSKAEKEYSLARASLVEFIPDKEEFHTRFDVLVKVPEDRSVKDLLEHVSGMTEELLRSASHSLEDVKSLLEENINAQDILVGHSLWSDFEALKWWHDNIVDTSFFFKVKPAPRLTLGLKDAVGHALLGEDQFQTGGAHDPVADAQFALKVAKFLADRAEGPFVDLDDVPSRFKKSITLYNLDVSRPDIKTILDQLAAEYDASIPKPMKVTTRDGKEYGSITFDFVNEDAAQRGFLAFPANVAMNHAEGFPDQAGFLKKYIKIDSITPPFVAEAASYLRQPLDGQIQWTCSKQNLGKMLGRGGERVLRIQRLCGAQISNAPKDKQHVVFTIRASDRTKCEAALTMLRNEDI